MHYGIALTRAGTPGGRDPGRRLVGGQLPQRENPAPKCPLRGGDRMKGTWADEDAETCREQIVENLRNRELLS